MIGLNRIKKLCLENIDAFGKAYDPRYPAKKGQIVGSPMCGAKHEGDGVASFANEILSEIRTIRREHRRKMKIKKARGE